MQLREIQIGISQATTHLSLWPILQNIYQKASGGKGQNEVH